MNFLADGTARLVEHTNASYEFGMTEPYAPARKDIPSLTGLRGVAAVSVVIYHCWNAAVEDIPHVTVPGQWAVDLFFVLSGFVLSLTYLDRKVNWRRFAVARFARVYPLHIVTALAMALILIAKAKIHNGPLDPSLMPGQLFRELTMTTAMPIVGRGLFWNNPSWSISVEAWTYILLFPVIAIAHQRAPLRLILPVVFLLLISLAAWLYSLPSGPVVITGWVALARAMIEFAGGWAAFLMWKSGRGWMSGTSTDLLSLLVVAVLCSVPVTSLQPWVLIILFPFLVAGLANGDSISSSALSGAVVLYLGDISYSIYLIHPLVIEGASPVLGHLGLRNNLAAWVVVVLPVTLAISAMTYRLIEKPSRDRLRAWLDPKDRLVGLKVNG